MRVRSLPLFESVDQPVTAGFVNMWMVIAVLASVFTAPLRSQTVVGSITRAGLFPTAVAVYEAGNKVFVADSTTQKVYTFDGSSFAELNSVTVGTGVHTIVVHH